MPTNPVRPRPGHRIAPALLYLALILVGILAACSDDPTAPP